MNVLQKEKKEKKEKKGVLNRTSLSLWLLALQKTDSESAKSRLPCTDGAGLRECLAEHVSKQCVEQQVTGSRDSEALFMNSSIF